jgi:N-acetylglutamate synthase-like GNAT family acetyltransferase
MAPKLPEHHRSLIMRPATLDDAAGVNACVHAAYEHYVARNGKVPGPMLDDYAELIPEHDVTVIERDDEIVAVLLVREGSEGFLLDNVAVTPACWGTGMGRYLLELAEDKARAAGFDSIYLYTQEVMTENQALYERIGYVEYARRTEIGLNRIYMRKRLD